MPEHEHLTSIATANKIYFGCANLTTHQTYKQNYLLEARNRIVPAFKYTAS